MFLRYVLPVLLLSPIVDARGELLGDASGRVLLGRPLDIVVQSSSSSLLGGRQGCVQAKVRYGDVPVPDADVQVSIETPSERGAGQGRIRVRVKRPLDEPFVSLTVAVGCGGQEGVFRREWVLLADWPASVGGASAETQRDGGAMLHGVVVAPSTGLLARSLSVAKPTGSDGGGSRQTPVVRRDTTRKAAAVVRAMPPLERRFSWNIDPAHLAVANAEGVASQDRLRLDVRDISEFDIFIARRIAEEWGVALPAAQDAASSVGTDQTEPVRQELQQVRAQRDALEKQVRLLEQQLADSRSSAWVWPVSAAALGLLLGGGVLWGAMRWRARQSASSPWWRLPAVSIDTGPASASGPGATEPPEVSGSFSAAVTTEQEAADRSRKVDAGHAEPAEAVADALLALWQTVDFLLSMWHSREAVASLQAFVEERPGASRAPYLYWYSLARLNDWADDAHRARNAHRRDFGFDVSDADVAPDAAGLDADVELMQRIARRWPHASARETLLAAIVDGRVTKRNEIPRRSLHAYDDLLLLWGIFNALPPAQDEKADSHAAVLNAAEESVSTGPLATLRTHDESPVKEVLTAPDDMPKTTTSESQATDEVSALEWEEVWTSPSRKN